MSNRETWPCKKEKIPMYCDHPECNSYEEELQGEKSLDTLFDEVIERRELAYAMTEGMIEANTQYELLTLVRELKEVFCGKSEGTRGATGDES